VEFDVREIFTGKSGRTMQKVIHVTMSHEDAMAFAYHILSGKFKAD
jgi:phosphopantetheinyl transferase (holo-ACP synthase)